MFLTLLTKLDFLFATSKIITAIIEIAVRIRQAFKDNGGHPPDNVDQLLALLSAQVPAKFSERYGIACIVKASGFVYQAMKSLSEGKEARKH